MTYGTTIQNQEHLYSKNVTFKFKNILLPERKHYGE